MFSTGSADACALKGAQTASASGVADQAHEPPARNPYLLGFRVLAHLVGAGKLEEDMRMLNSTNASVSRRAFCASGRRGKLKYVRMLNLTNAYASRKLLEQLVGATRREECLRMVYSTNACGSLQCLAHLVSIGKREDR